MSYPRAQLTEQQRPRVGARMSMGVGPLAVVKPGQGELGYSRHYLPLTVRSASSLRRIGLCANGMTSRRSIVAHLVFALPRRADSLLTIPKVAARLSLDRLKPWCRR